MVEMKIYVVTSGECFDYGIEIVTTKREVAETYIKNHAGWWWGISGYKIEEYDDYDGFTSDLDELKDKEMVYRFLTGKDRDNFVQVTRCYESKDLKSRITVYRNFYTDTYYYIYVHCDDKEKAIKIARDMWAKYKAEKLGL